MATENLKPANYKVVYEGKDITEDLRPMFVSMKYVDSVEGESSSLEITLDNVDRLWSNDWYQNKGDKITASIGGLECGTFTIDEVELSGPPDTVRIQCLENMITKQQLRTKRSKAHEGKTLSQIAQHVASANGLTLVGSVPNITFERISQHRETDLKFLRRISYQFGIIFSVRDDKLIYTKLSELDKKKAAFSVHRTEMMNYKCIDKTFNTFSAVILKYHDAKTGDVISHSAKAGGKDSGGIITMRNDDGIAYPQIVSGDTMSLHHRVENKKQAIISAESLLYRSNTLQQSGTFSIEGTELAVAGVNMEATGLGIACSGIWNIRKASHSIDRGNDWVVELEVKRIALISAEKAKAKADASKGGSGGGGGLSDLIGTGNTGSGNYVQNGKLQYPSIGGKDVTKEKAEVQQAIRFVIATSEANEGKIIRSKVQEAIAKIRAAVSSMVAKEHNGLAQQIRSRVNEVMSAWLSANESDASHGNALGEQLITDIPEMNDTKRTRFL